MLLDQKQVKKRMGANLAINTEDTVYFSWKTGAIPRKLYKINAHLRYLQF